MEKCKKRCRRSAVELVPEGAHTVERMSSGWILYLSDPPPTEPENGSIEPNNGSVAKARR